jgi:hydrogenase-4 membrane subunit HyfE
MSKWLKIAGIIILVILFLVINFFWLLYGASSHKIPEYIHDRFKITNVIFILIFVFIIYQNKKNNEKNNL